MKHERGESTTEQSRQQECRLQERRVSSRPSSMMHRTSRLRVCVCWSLIIFQGVHRRHAPATDTATEPRTATQLHARVGAAITSPWIVTAHLWVPERHPRFTRANSDGEAVGGSQAHGVTRVCGLTIHHTYSNNQMFLASLVWGPTHSRQQMTKK